MNSTSYSSINQSNHIDVNNKKHYQRQISTPNSCAKSPSSVNFNTPLLGTAGTSTNHVDTNHGRRFSMFPSNQKYSYWRSFEAYSGISNLQHEVRRTGSLYARRPKRKSKDYQPIGKG
jgi:hypothetical protein